jgi:23S rRNA U2552 (ribose-2'-O)-methylase RlmE/FtsJ
MNFQFEKNNALIEIKNISIKEISKDNNLLFKNYYDNISREKEKIDELSNVEDWDKMKKIGNPYELIYTTYNKKRKNDSISLYSPISRSYFKLWEIFYNYNIFENFNKNEKYIHAHLAEGPGGFMEATYNYRSKILNTQNLGDIFYGITLKPTSDYVPDWTKIKKVFNNSPNINIEYGNLYNIDDVKNYLKLFKKNKAHFSTADGGFDYSTNFNRQEVNSCKIIYSETVIALNVLRKGGSFICKVFDLFTYSMVQILYLLYNSFEKIIIYKPETSRPANSEKYIICINYYDNIEDNEKNNLIENIRTWNNITNEENTAILDNIKINSDFIHILSDYNLKYINHQAHYLKNTIKISQKKIEKEEYNELINNQVVHAINWCKKYNVKINENSIYYKKNIV